MPDPLVPPGPDYVQNALAALRGSGESEEAKAARRQEIAQNAVKLLGRNPSDEQLVDAIQAAARQQKGMSLKREAIAEDAAAVRGATPWWLRHFQTTGDLPPREDVLRKWPATPMPVDETTREAHEAGLARLREQASVAPRSEKHDEARQYLTVTPTTLAENVDLYEGMGPTQRALYTAAYQAVTSNPATSWVLRHGPGAPEIMSAEVAERLGSQGYEAPREIADRQVQEEMQRSNLSAVTGLAGQLSPFMYGMRALKAVPGLGGEGMIPEAARFAAYEAAAPAINAAVGGPEPEEDALMRAGGAANLGFLLRGAGAVTGPALQRALPGQPGMQRLAGEAITGAGLGAATAPEGEAERNAVLSAIAFPLVGRLTPGGAPFRGRGVERPVEVKRPKPEEIRRPEPVKEPAAEPAPVSDEPVSVPVRPVELTTPREPVSAREIPPEPVAEPTPAPAGKVTTPVQRLEAGVRRESEALAAMREQGLQGTPEFQARAKAFLTLQKNYRKALAAAAETRPPEPQEAAPKPTAAEVVSNLSPKDQRRLGGILERLEALSAKGKQDTIEFQTLTSEWVKLTAKARGESVPRGASRSLVGKTRGEKSPFAEVPQGEMDLLDPGAARKLARTPGAAAASPIAQQQLRRPSKPEDIVSKSDVFDSLQVLRSKLSKIGVSGPHRKARPGPKTLGEYDTKSEAIALRRSRDAATFAHEVAHHVQKHSLGGFDKARAFTEEFRNELEPLAGQPQLPKGASGEKAEAMLAMWKANAPLEGMAEFVTLYTSRPYLARKAAPRFYEALETKLRKDSPETLALMKEAQAAGIAFLKQNPIDRLGSVIHYPLRNAWRETFSADPNLFWHRAVSGILDDLHIINVIESTRARQRGTPVRAGDDLRILSSVTKQSPAAHAFLYDGVVKFDPASSGEALVPGSKSVQKILSQIRPDEIHPFNTYFVARRVEELSRLAMEYRQRAQTTRNKQEKRDLLDAAKRYENTVLGLARQAEVKVTDFPDMARFLESEFPTFSGILKDFKTFSDGLVDYRVDAGELSPKEGKRLKEEINVYVPFYRRMEDYELAMRPGPGGGWARVPRAKKITGETDRQIIDPIQNFVQHVYESVSMADRSHLQRKIIDAVKEIEGGHVFAEQVRNPPKAHTIALREMKRWMEQNNIPIPQGMSLDTAFTYFRPGDALSMLKETGVIAVRRGKKTEYWKLSPELQQAMERYTYGSMVDITNVLVKIAAPVTRVLRNSIILSPGFQVVNTMRDQLTRYPRTGRAPFVGYASALLEVAGQKPTYQNLKAFGAFMGTLSQSGIKQRAKEIRAIHRGALPIRQRGVILTARQLLSRYTELGEVPTRLDVGRRRLREPLAQDVSARDQLLRAAYEAREASVDFSRRGSATRTMSQITAFFNPAVQGTAKAAQDVATHPVRSLVYFTGWVTLGNLIYRLNHDEDWKEEVHSARPESDSNLYIPFIVGTRDSWEEAKRTGDILAWQDKHVWKVPKPYDIGLVAYEIGEKFLGPLIAGEDRLTKKRMAMQGVKTMAGAAAPGFIPDIARPLLEGWANKSFHTGRPLTPMRLSENSPEEQYTEYTSEVAKKLGGLVGIAPTKIDNAIQMGDLMRSGLAGIDDVIRFMEDQPRPPTEGMARKHGISLLMSRFQSNFPTLSTANISTLYDLAAEARQVERDLKKMRADGRKAEAKAVMKDKADIIAMSGVLSAFVDKMAAVRRKRTKIHMDQSLAPDEKRREIDLLILDAVEDANRLMRRLEEANAPEAGPTEAVHTPP